MGEGKGCNIKGKIPGLWLEKVNFFFPYWLHVYAASCILGAGVAGKEETNREMKQEAGIYREAREVGKEAVRGRHWQAYKKDVQGEIRETTSYQS